jgi:hypothetical protein
MKDHQKKKRKEILDRKKEKIKGTKQKKTIKDSARIRKKKKKTNKT